MLLSVNLATMGYRVAVVDADRNQSFASWHQQAYEGPEFTCRSEIDHIKVVDLAAELSEEHEVVLVDTAGFESSDGSLCHRYGRFRPDPLHAGSWQRPGSDADDAAGSQFEQGS